jgi:hypothetical protein
LKAVSETLEVPLFAVMTMPDVVPTSLAAGVPVSAPETVLNVAQAGLFAIE